MIPQFGGRAAKFGSLLNYCPMTASSMILSSMDWRTRILFPAAFLALFLPLPTLAHDLSGEAAVTVHLTPEGYEPKNATIQQGETVAFENTASVEMWPASNIHPTHEIYSDFDPKRPVAPGETWTFTFDQAGVWVYHDHLYPTVTGTITVTAPADTSPQQTLTGEEQPGLFARFAESLLSTWRRLLGRQEEPAALEAEQRPFDPAIAADDASVFSDYDRLYSYVKKFGTAKTMQHLHNLSSTLGSCHDPAHRVGRYAFELTANEAFQTCTAECHSGCYHGATELFFKKNGTANLQENLPTICSFSTNSFFSHQCIHGIGHGLMAWANYDLPQALANCDILESATSRESCYTGVFMENVVGTLGEGQASGHATSYLSDDPHFPCSVVEDAYKGSCYFFQTSRMMRLFNGDFAKIAAACREAPAPFQTHCFGSMGRDVGGVHRGNPAGAIASCREAPAGSARQDCLAGAVQNTFWDPSGQAEALDFCAQLTVPAEQQRCYDTIFERAGQVLPPGPEQDAFCAQAKAAYQARCRSFVP
jgi:plastocyanin